MALPTAATAQGLSLESVEEIGTVGSPADVEVGDMIDDDLVMIGGAAAICSGDAAFDPAADLDGDGCVDAIDAPVVPFDTCDPSDARYPNVIQEAGTVTVEDCGPLCLNFPVPPVGEWEAPPLRVAVATLDGVLTDYDPNVCSSANPGFLGFAPMRCPEDVPPALRWLYEACLTVSTASAFDTACAILPPPIASVCRAAATGGQLACCDAVLNTRVPPAWQCAYLDAAATASCPDCCRACCDAAWPVDGDGNVVENAACTAACGTPPTTSTTLPTTTTTSTTATSTTTSTSTSSTTSPTATSTTTVAPTTSTVTLPSTTSTTSTTTSTTTTSTFPATTCGNAKIAEPTTLPDQTTCTADATAAGTQTLCRGWETVGPLFQGPADLASTPPSAAQLYQWKSGDTTCFYLYRFQPGAPRVATLNGVHCYNTKTCEVCAWDYKGRRPTLWRQLVPPPDPPLPPPAPKFEDCSECHASGPVTPRKPFHAKVSPATELINAVCADKGGPSWINAPGTWAKADTARKVAAVGKCRGCHATFVTARLFCKAIMLPTFTPGGAMKSSDFKDKATCDGFARKMGCDDPLQDLPILCAGLK